MGKIYLIILFVFSLNTYAGNTDTREVSAANAAVEPNVHMSFYPNPCPKMLNVDLNFDRLASTVEIHLRTIIGKDVVEFITDDKLESSNHYELDLSEIPAGVYLLEVITYSNGVATKTIKRVTKI
ncbi:MAG: T9SS type A sorting domain-containing protein [Bacteroidetes bacterium]|nr:T9SS type A sorting domain-containing protein [Bacteroidota bacterium]